MKVEACSIGPIAKLALQQSGRAQTIACFDRSLYLETDDQIICVADQTLYDGPINLLVRQSEGSPSLFSSGLAVGQAWRLEANHLALIDGAETRIGFASASLWKPNRTTWPSGSDRMLRASIAWWRWQRSDLGKTTF